MMQFVGDHRAADQVIWRRREGEPHWTVCWLAASRLVAVLAVGLPRELTQGRRLIDAAVPVDAARVADPGVPLRDCAL